MVKEIYKMSAKWCAPCHVYAKTFNEVKNDAKYKGIEFKEFDIEEREDLTEKYKIRNIPTTIFLDENNNVMQTISGNIPKKVLEEKINDLLHN